MAGKALNKNVLISLLTLPHDTITSSRWSSPDSIPTPIATPPTCGRVLLPLGEGAPEGRTRGYSGEARNTAAVCTYLHGSGNEYPFPVSTVTPHPSHFARHLLA